MYDVAISYSEKDQDKVADIIKQLQNNNSAIVIHQKQFVYNHTQVWQEDIFDIMVHSKKFVYINRSTLCSLTVIISLKNF